MPDFVYTAADAIPTTPTRRWEANIEAIRTLKQLEAEGRPATPEKQAKFARYSGFGDSAFEQAFVQYPHDRTWKARGEELRDVTTQEEYRAIEGSRINAFYTSREVIETIWNGLERMGATNLENPRILEPSAGSGRFLGLQPAEMAKRSDRTAVELDSITGRILKHTYPDAKVMITGFEKAPITAPGGPSSAPPAGRRPSARSYRMDPACTSSAYSQSTAQAQSHWTWDGLMKCGPRSATLVASPRRGASGLSGGRAGYCCPAIPSSPASSPGCRSPGRSSNPHQHHNPHWLPPNIGGHQWRG